MGIANRYLMAIVIGIAVVRPVYALSCLQCNSMVRRECVSADVKSTPCDNSSIYCEKYEGKFEDEHVVVRDCQTKNRDLTCHPKLFDDTEVEVCYYVCTTDGCNSANSISSFWSCVILGMFHVFFIFEKLS
ncbi:hypothetical protein ScPMuIL_004477 [Solemya velum]